MLLKENNNCQSEKAKKARKIKMKKNNQEKSRKGKIN